MEAMFSIQEKKNFVQMIWILVILLWQSLRLKVSMLKMLLKIFSAYTLPQEILYAGATRTHATVKTVSLSDILNWSNCCIGVSFKYDSMVEAQGFT